MVGLAGVPPEMRRQIGFHMTIIVLCLTLLVSVPSVQGSSNTNNNGNITWAELPEGTPYTTKSEYDEGSFPLPTTWDFIDSFLKTISPAAPPYELINELIAQQDPDIVNKVTGSITEFQGNLLGFAICFVLGALFVVLFPLVCLCFCCCRCCNNCGGKMYQEQKDSDRCTRICLSTSLLIVSAIIMGGIGTAYSVNIFMSGTVETLPDDIVANIDDMRSFVDNTLAEIDFIFTDQLFWTADAFVQDLRDIDVLVGVPVRDGLNANVGPAIAAIYPLATAIDNTYSAMQTVSTTQNMLASNWESFVAALDAVRGELQADCQACSGCCIGAYPSELTLTINADYRDVVENPDVAKFPQSAVDVALGELKIIQDQKLAKAADVGKASFNNIPEVLKNTTTGPVDTVDDNLEDLRTKLPELLNLTRSQLSVFDNELAPARNMVREYGVLIQDYDSYRVYAVYGLYSVFLLTVALNLLGLMCGFCGYDKDATPTLRGSVSNCGGLTLMSAVGVSMIFATFYMLFTTLTFIIGGPVDRLVCDPIVSRQLFSETVDKKDAIVPGYYLGDLLFKNNTVPLTVTGILDDCEANAGVYDAFQLRYFFNITELLNFREQIPDIDDQFDDISGDFSSVEILTQETKDILIDFRDSSADLIIWTVSKQEFAKDLTNDPNDPNDLSVYAGLLRTFAAGLNDGSKFEAHADTIDNLQTMYVAPLRTTATRLISEIEILESHTDTIDTTVDRTISAAETAQEYLDNNVASFVTNEINIYKNRILNYIDQFVNYALEQIMEEVGQCKPVVNLWNSATRILCRNLLESFNAIWLTLGWCTVFLMPSIIFGVKLAKHYRIMDYEDGYDDYLTPHEMEMAHMNQSPMYPASLVRELQARRQFRQRRKYSTYKGRVIVKRRREVGNEKRRD